MRSHDGFNRFIYAICAHLGSACKVCVFSTYLFMLSVYFLISFSNELAVGRRLRDILLFILRTPYCARLHSPILFGLESRAYVGFGH